MLAARTHGLAADRAAQPSVWRCWEVRVVGGIDVPLTLIDANAGGYKISIAQIESARSSEVTFRVATYDRQRRTTLSTLGIH